MVLINGVATDTVASGDRGLHYGDGLFETFAVQDEEPLCWERHMARLLAGCQRLRLPCPDAGLLWNESKRVCAGLRAGVLKLIVTRGAGGRGYRPPQTPAPARVVIAYPRPSSPSA